MIKLSLASESILVQMVWKNNKYVGFRWIIEINRGKFVLPFFCEIQVDEALQELGRVILNLDGRVNLDKFWREMSVTISVDH